MALTPEVEAQLAKIYGVDQGNAAPQLNPDKEAQLAKIYGVELKDNYQPDAIRSGYHGIMENVAKPINQAVSGAIGLAGEQLGEMVTPEGKATFEKAKNYVATSPVGVAIKEGATQIGENIDDLAQYNPNLKADLSALGQNAQLAMNAPILKPVASAIGTVASPVIKGVAEGASARYAGLKALKPDALDEAMSVAKDNISNLYKAVDATGATVKPEISNNLGSQLVSIIEASPINPAASPKTLGAVKELYTRITKGKINPLTGEVTQAPMTVSELDGYRKLLSGIQGEDAVVANNVRDVIDNHLKELSPTDFVGGGTDAPELLFKARAEAAKTFKMEDVASMLKKADGDQRSIKAQFTKYINKKDWERGLSAEEQQAFKDAAKNGIGEKIERGLGTFGIDLGKHKNVALPVLAGASTGVGVSGGLPLIATGTIARQSGKLAARGKAQKVFDLISERPTNDIIEKAFQAKKAAEMAKVSDNTLALPAPPARNMRPEVQVFRAAQQKTATQQSDHAYIEHLANLHGIDTEGKTTKQLIKEIEASKEIPF